MEKDKFMELLVVNLKAHLKTLLRETGLKKYTDKEIENMLCNIGLYILEKNNDIVLRNQPRTGDNKK